LSRYGFDLVRIRRTGSREPAASHRVNYRQQACRKKRQPANTFVAQGSCAHTAFGRMAKGATVPNVDDRDGSEVSARRGRHLWRPARPSLPAGSYTTTIAPVV